MMQVVTEGKISWTDVENPTSEEIEKLAKDYPFHPLNLDDCLSRRQLPKVEEHENHIFLLFHIPNFEENRIMVVKGQVSIFIGKDFVVTIHGSDVKRLTSLFLNYMENEKLRAASMASTPRIVHSILDVLVDDLYPTLSKIRGDLEEIEDKVFDERRSVAVELSRLRRAIADLRRIISPLRELPKEIWLKTQAYSKEDLSKYFNDVGEHAEKAWDLLGEARETIEIFKDTDYVLSTELTNKVLAVLTVIFTLTIPVTVIGAIYGMNVPLPGGIQAGAPTFLGPFTSFIILMVVSAASALSMVFYFRHKGWF
ncbi:MAG: magnesium transporter CorA family protein [Thaumarchaeota archaeon]|nr:magnesium transporter CorA family protein [Nitrososphaerota archaeon]